MDKPLTHSDIYDVNETTGALIIGTNRLDDYATIFLNKYCAEALTTPMALPVDKMLETAKLTVETASLSKNLDIFGCCLLLDGYVNVYHPAEDKYIPTFYKAGTLLFDPDSEWTYGEGCKRNTLIHEMVHWDKDHTYFQILQRKNKKAKEQLYPIMCRQSRANYEPPYGKRTKQNEVEWLEWQAHRLAPRILMPKDMFIQKAEEYLRRKPKDCDELVDRLANFFIVSRTSTKIRLVEVGIAPQLVSMPDYEDVFGELRRKEHVPLSVQDAFDLLGRDDILSYWVETNHMVFADGYFVIADKKYVNVKDGQLHLTRRARRNLPACTLNICEQYIVSRKIADKDYCGYTVLLHAVGVNQKLLSFHPAYQAEFRTFLMQEQEAGKSSPLSDVSDSDVYDAVAANLVEEMDETKKEFLRKLGDPFTTLCKCLWYWFETHGMRYPDKFWNATLLHKNYHNSIKNNKKNNMGKSTLMAICVGMKFDLRTALKVFDKAGLPLNEFKEPDRTYIAILDRAPGVDIEEVNEILTRRGIKALGSSTDEE